MKSIIFTNSATTTGAVLATWEGEDIREQAKDTLKLLGFGNQMGAACATTQR